MSADLWRSERLVYRAVEPEDETFFATLNSDSEAFTQAAPMVPAPQSKHGTKIIIDIFGKALLGVIVCLPAPAAGTSSAPPAEGLISKPIPIGMVCLRGRDALQIHHQNAEMGIQIMRPYRGQGYGSETIKWALGWGFRFANLHRIQLGVYGHNKRAKKLYESLGFVLEATLREAHWHDGEWYDDHFMGMLDREWRESYGKKGQQAIAGASTEG